MKPRPLNEHVLAVCVAMPRGGGYRWPTSEPGVGGSLEDVHHRGTRVLKAGSGTYCCGLTLEVLFKAYAAAGAEPPITAAQARELQRIWFITTDEARPGPAIALPRFGLGEAVPPDTIRPGDFVQFWRANGSGHSVVALGYDKASKELTYFSTQRSTNGIGVVKERPAEIHAGRAFILA